MWTPDALASEARPYAREVWRVVESQYQASTMRITDTLEEQGGLERLLDGAKPPLPPDCAGLDYLLAAPFRYAPYPFGSRFRRARQSEGAFYAAESVETAIAEVAFYRLLFFAESPGARLPANPVEHTAFSVQCRTDRLIDLTEPPLNRDEAQWTNRSDYAACQDVADASRTAGLQAIRYRSVRDPGGGANVALLTPAAFAVKRPKRLQMWRVFPRPNLVQAWSESPAVKLEFRRADFGADPRLGP